MPLLGVGAREIIVWQFSFVRSKLRVVKSKQTPFPAAGRDLVIGDEVIMSHYKNVDDLTFEWDEIIMVG